MIKLQGVFIKYLHRLEPLKSLQELPGQHPPRILNQNGWRQIWASRLCKNALGDANVKPG